MKIINKSGKEVGDTNSSFYIILSSYELQGLLDEGKFSCSEHGAYSTEEDAIEGLDPGYAVAKITLVAKIV